MMWFKKRGGGLMMKELPDWIVTLESEDLEFIKKFVLNSGILK